MSVTPVPLLIYDAACTFCRRWIARWRARTGDRVAYVPFQSVDGDVLRRLGVSPAEARRAIQLVTPAGTRHQGAEAVFRALEHAPELRFAVRVGRPFPDRPPRYVRALLYEYRMTDREARRRTGAWWHRELLGVYVPTCALAPRAP